MNNEAGARVMPMPGSAPKRGSARDGSPQRTETRVDRVFCSASEKAELQQATGWFSKRSALARAKR